MRKAGTKLRKTLFALMMGATMIASAPMALLAQPQRVYDRDHKDYHEWNDGEGRAYRHWVVEERHRPYVEWGRASRAQQRDYWRWRHEHSDWR